MGESTSMDSPLKRRLCVLRCILCGVVAIVALVTAVFAGKKVVKKIKNKRAVKASKSRVRKSWEQAIADGKIIYTKENN